MSGFTNIIHSWDDDLYLWVSNSSSVDVFFDGLVATHKTGPLLQEDHYYPFGLGMNGLSSKAIGRQENRFKFNAGTELAAKEFSDGAGLELFETNYRLLDPQIGRFWQVDPMAEEAQAFSPFAFANNNPILLNDPLGLMSDSLHPIEMERVTVVGYRKKKEPSSPNPGGSMFAFGGVAVPLGGAGTGMGAGTASATGIGAIVVASVWAQVKLSELDRNLRENRWYITYKKIGPRGEVYIGRCSGFGATAEEVLAKYDRYHRLDKLKFGEAQLIDKLNGSIFEKIAPPGSNTFNITEISGYAATRGREQQLFAFYQNQGTIMANKINPVSPLNPLGPTYFAASNLAFGPLVAYRDLYR